MITWRSKPNVLWLQSGQGLGAALNSKGRLPGTYKSEPLPKREPKFLSQMCIEK